MTKKTVEETFSEFDAEVTVKYEDGEVEEIRIEDQGVLGRLKSSKIRGGHLSVVRKLIEDGFPE